MIRDKENLDFELMDERYDDDTQDAIAEDPTHEIHGRVMTAFQFTPTGEAWSAWFDLNPEWLTGSGATEAAAIENLFAQVLDSGAELEEAA